MHDRTEPMLSSGTKPAILYILRRQHLCARCLLPAAKWTAWYVTVLLCDMQFCKGLSSLPAACCRTDDMSQYVYCNSASGNLSSEHYVFYHTDAVEDLSLIRAPSDVSEAGRQGWLIPLSPFLTYAAYLAQYAQWTCTCLTTCVAPCLLLLLACSRSQFCSPLHPIRL